MYQVCFVNNYFIKKKRSQDGSIYFLPFIFLIKLKGVLCCFQHAVGNHVYPDGKQAANAGNAVFNRRRDIHILRQQPAQHTDQERYQHIAQGLAD